MCAQPPHSGLKVSDNRDILGPVGELDPDLASSVRAALGWEWGQCRIQVDSKVLQ
jgi:hypothetical protein